MLTADLVQVPSLFVVRQVRVLGAVLEKTPVQRKTVRHDGFITDLRQPLVKNVLLKAILDRGAEDGSELGYLGTTIWSTFSLQTHSSFRRRSSAASWGSELMRFLGGKGREK